MKGWWGKLCASDPDWLFDAFWRCDLELSSSYFGDSEKMAKGKIFLPSWGLWETNKWRTEANQTLLRHHSFVHIHGAKLVQHIFLTIMFSLLHSTQGNTSQFQHDPDQSKSKYHYSPLGKAFSSSKRTAAFFWCVIVELTNWNIASCVKTQRGQSTDEQGYRSNDHKDSGKQTKHTNDITTEPAMSHLSDRTPCTP